MAESFTLWLEFEAYDDTEEREYCNIQITVGETKYALNIWTCNFLMQRFQEKSTTPKNEIAPDLIVAQITRENLQKVVSKMLEENELKPEWVVHD